VVGQVQFTGPPPRRTSSGQSRDREGAQSGPADTWSADSQAATSNHVIISALTFLPKHERRGRKLPLIVLAHGEIHGNIASDESPNLVRELVAKGYAVIAPDYRGSSGYGAEFWRLIDYGGLEIADMDAARQWMLSHHRQVDPQRVGIIGWSHGGAIALLTVFAHPQDYQVCYAGVPVSDLEERVQILGKGYEELFSAPYHLGKKLEDDPDE